eukprot:TRINITY_DN63264_c0_g1_i1.p1 TRINITY_DN63264_c0_g1~~TRINITY_DN63264_c0_g1_i1.p1  ORF type:complete len:177 (+),score=28.31 TRINITY_DN63264_c0_g1_i1:142-672(+)
MSFTRAQRDCPSRHGARRSQRRNHSASGISCGTAHHRSEAKSLIYGEFGEAAPGDSAAAAAAALSRREAMLLQNAAAASAACAESYGGAREVAERVKNKNRGGNIFFLPQERRESRRSNSMVADAAAARRGRENLGLECANQEARNRSVSEARAGREIAAARNRGAGLRDVLHGPA